MTDDSFDSFETSSASFTVSSYCLTVLSYLHSISTTRVSQKTQLQHSTDAIEHLREDVYGHRLIQRAQTVDTWLATMPDVKGVWAVPGSHRSFNVL